MLARKEPAAGELVHERAAVAARDVDALALASFIAPGHGEAMRRVLAGEAGQAREAPRADFLEADETDAGHGAAVVQLRPERRRELSLRDVGIEAEIDQQPPADDAANARDAHAFTPPLR